MISSIQGYKTYILAALGVLYALSGFFTGNLDANTALSLGWAALGMAAIRHGVSTTGSN